MKAAEFEEKIRTLIERHTALHHAHSKCESEITRLREENALLLDENRRAQKILTENERLSTQQKEISARVDKLLRKLGMTGVVA